MERGPGLRQSLRHYLVFGTNYRKVQKRNDQRIIPFFVPCFQTYFSKIRARDVPIHVPESVKLFLRPYEDGIYLMRLHNTDPK